MCTAINLCEDGLFGRTLDFERSFGEGVVFSPRDSLPIGEAKNRYAMLGIGVVKGDKVLYFDGLNEWGLSGAALNFQGYAVYKKSGEAKENIKAPWLCDKFKRITAPFLSKEGQEKIISMIVSDENMPIRELVNIANTKEYWIG